MTENRLAQENSPYLLQHASNPVDWQPWDEEAWEEARTENKPVFLSIGYSTCHWCHVMARESFQNQEIAEILNKNFVAIKVDREERPDIDKIYMEVCQALTGKGGWPLSVFLTPEQKPFYAGTYFPPESRRGLPGFKDLLLQIKELWQNKREEILTSADNITVKVKELVQERVSSNEADEVISEENKSAIINKLTKALQQKFDYQAGGFGSAPKFPQTDHINFLLSLARYKNSRTAEEMARKSLDNMLAGGIYDHVAGGLFRYATDKNWEIPHFEKMLYDNALLLKTLADFYQFTKEEKYADSLEEIFSFLQREMKLEEGGYAAALDAESSGVEGGFYLWTEEEIELALKRNDYTQEDVSLLKEYLNITKEGNFKGRNNPSLGKEGFARRDDRIKNMLATLREFRAANKERPARDYKILTAWNSLLAGALAQAAAVTGKEEYHQESKKIIDFITENLYEDGQLFIRQARGERAFQGTLDDYSFFLSAVLDYYRLAGEAKYLELALELANTLEAEFKTETGCFYHQSNQAERLLYNPTPGSSSSLPSGNAVAAESYQRLGLITGDLFWQQRAQEIIASFASSLNKIPEAYSGMIRLLLLEEERSLMEIFLPAKDEAEIKKKLTGLVEGEMELLFLTDKNISRYRDLLSRNLDFTPLETDFSARICKVDRCIENYNSWRELESTFQHNK